MAATERQLKSTLALYLDYSSGQTPQPERIFGSTTGLLTSLTNPLNISLLTSHFLAAPALWPSPHRQHPLDLQQAAHTCFRVLSVYNTAALHVHRHAEEEAAAARHGLLDHVVGLADRRPATETWARAVAHLPRSRRAALEDGVVTAANLALDEAAAADATDDKFMIEYAIVLSLVYAFPLLGAHARARLHSDALLPCIVASLTGPLGFDGGRILEAIEADLETQPAVSLVVSAGPVTTLAAFAVEHARAPQAQPVLDALDRLLVFSQELAGRWAACRRLAGVHLSADAAEAAQLSAETAQTTWPLLWQHLRRALYAAAVVLQAIVGRSLLDRALSGDDRVAPRLAATVLHVLGHLHFVSARGNAGAFQAYQFTYLASMDILSRYTDAAAAFLGQLLPPRPTPLAAAGITNNDHNDSNHNDFLRLTADLFYLNTAEQFAASLPTEACDRLLLQPAWPYLAPAPVLLGQPSPPPPLIEHASPRMVEMFEAAHSVTLAVLACPHNAPLAATLSPAYATMLFAAFPGRISARQFRLAFATLIQILSPPFPVYATHPALAETLLEMVRFRAVGGTAGTTPLQEGDEAVAAAAGGGGRRPPVSEQSALVLTLIDALPFLALPVLEEWMTTAAEALWTIGGDDPALRQTAQRRFWEVLGSGEMDVERAAIGVAWWGNGGGGALVMTGRRHWPAAAASSGQGGDALIMSGALPDPHVASTRL
ncbi:peroxisomal membrane protein [Niveomyces insectorum RCEF 264]|uniref:Peroxisomal membrane protein n=1 Tax=Niveomyces insectorum RCEF 264 TaxID=1081102 RepID=A0A167RHB6_9HYPO|nr:peroxisomal membrane protein [Niveomyces insectorum RCEF 264]